MATASDSSARNEDRHSHISIRLQYLAHGQWAHLQALGWNAQGFNFFWPEPIAEPLLELKRGLTHFTGSVVWSAVSTDDLAVQETIVNELVFKRARDVVNDPAMQARLLKLIRVPGMVAQKRKVLASLGLDIGDAKMAELVARRKQERPLIHYGVQVHSALWATVVADTLPMSSVVAELDLWSRSLGKK